MFQNVSHSNQKLCSFLKVWWEESSLQRPPKGRKKISKIFNLMRLNCATHFYFRFNYFHRDVEWEEEEATNINKIGTTRFCFGVNRLFFACNCWFWLLSCSLLEFIERISSEGKMKEKWKRREENHRFPAARNSEHFEGKKDVAMNAKCEKFSAL